MSTPKSEANACARNDIALRLENVTLAWEWLIQEWDNSAGNHSSKAEAFALLRSFLKQSQLAQLISYVDQQFNASKLAKPVSRVPQVPMEHAFSVPKCLS